MRPQRDTHIELPRPCLTPSFLPMVGPEKSTSLGTGCGSSTRPGRCVPEMGAGKRQTWAPSQGFSTSCVLESPCGFLAVVDIIILQCCAWKDLFCPCNPLYLSSAITYVDVESRRVGKSIHFSEQQNVKGHIVAYQIGRDPTHKSEGWGSVCCKVDWRTCAPTRPLKDPEIKATPRFPLSHSSPALQIQIQ